MRRGGVDDGAASVVAILMTDVEPAVRLNAALEAAAPAKRPRASSASSRAGSDDSGAPPPPRPPTRASLMSLDINVLRALAAYYLRTMSATHAEKSTVSSGRMNAVSSESATPSAARSVSLLEAAAAAAQEQITLSASAATDIKFCGVDDPTCESCQ
jgi:hypothetical protein